MDARLPITLDPQLDIGKLNVILRSLRDSLGDLGKNIKLVDSKQLQADLAAARSQLEQLGDASSSIREKVRGLGDETAPLTGPPTPGPGNTAFKIAMIGQAAQQVTGAIQQLSQPFVDLDAQVRNIGTLGVANFEEYRDLALQMSKDVPDSAAQIAAAAYDAISAGVQGSSTEIMEFVKTASKLGVAGADSTQGAVNSLTSTLNAYKASVSEAGRYSDIMFNAINVGKTTLPELNASLYNVVPTAAAFGVKFQDIAAALASMTKQGTPTASATTQLRQALVELAKPSATLAPVLAKAGVSLNSLKQDGLQATLAKVGKALQEMGLSATQAFGSVEAASAVMLLSGDNASMAATDLEAVAAATGTVDKAYSVAADGAANKTKILLNNVTAQFSAAFSVIGSGVISTANAMASLSPTLLTLASMKELIPSSAMTKTAGALKNVLLPQLVSLAPAFGTIGKEGTSTIKALGSGLGQLAMNPVFLAFAGLTAAVVGLHYLSTAFEETAAERQKDLDAQQRMADANVQEKQSAIQRAETMQRLAAEYSALGREVTALGEESEVAANKKERMAIIAQQIDGIYPGVISKSASLYDNVLAVEDAARRGADGLGMMRDELKRLEEQKLDIDVTSSVNRVDVAMEELTDQLKDAYSSVFDDITNWIFADSGAEHTAEAYVSSFGISIKNAKNQQEVDAAVQDFIQNINNQIERGDISAADGEKMIAGIQKIGETRIKAIEAEAKRAAARMQEEIDAVMNPSGEVKRITVQIDTLVNTEKLVGEYEVAAQKAAELAAKLDAAKKSGASDSSVKQIEKDYNAAQQAADGMLGRLSSVMPGVVRETGRVVDATGNIKVQYDASTAAMRQYIVEQKNAYNAEIMQQQGRFVDGVRNQAGNYAKAGEEMAKLREQWVAGKITQEEFNAGQRKAADEQQRAYNATIDGIARMEDAGANTEVAVKEVASAWGMSVEQVKALVAKQRESRDATKDQQQAAEDAAKAWKDMRSSADDNLNKLIAEIALMKVNNEQDKSKLALKIAQAKAAKQQLDSLDKVMEDTKRELGMVKSTGAARKEAASAANDELQAKLRAIALDAETQRILRDGARLLAGRKKSALDDLVNAQEALAVERRKLDTIKESYRISADGAIGVTASLRGDKKKSAEAKIRQELAEAVNAVNSASNAVVEVQLQIDGSEDKIMDTMRGWKFEDLRVMIEYGMATQDDLRSALLEEKARLEEVVRQAQQAGDQEAELAAATSIRQISAQLRDIKKAEYELELADLETSLTRQERARQESIDRMVAMDARFRAVFQAAERRAADASRDDALRRLEKRKEAEAMTEEIYEKRKQEIEMESQRRIAASEAMYAAREKEAARKEQLADLERQRMDVESRLALAKKYGDKKEVEALTKSLSLLNDEIQSKGSDLMAATQSLQQGVSDSIAAMFAGDPEAMKDSARAMFASMAAILEKQATAMALSVVLSQGTTATISALPFPANIIALAAIQAAVQGMVMAMLRPVMSSLLSFSTGGRVDEPTIAMIGDASRLGGVDTEWVMRDQQLMQYAAMAAASASQPVAQKMDQLIAAVQGLYHERLFLRGADVWRSTKIQQTEVMRRRRR